MSDVAVKLAERLSTLNWLMATAESCTGGYIAHLITSVPGSSEYSYARIAIVQGAHSLSNPQGLIGYVYGFGYIESYGFAVGASLDNLNFETKNKYEFDHHFI